jgi:diguanylate cyclase (GGDEF)-like protein
MSELQASRSLSEWWASERPQVAALFPQRCDEVITRTAVAMQRAEVDENVKVLADAASMRARAHVARGEPELAARILHELLNNAVDRFEPVDRAAMTAALGVAYESLGKYAEALDLLHEAHTAYESANDVRGMASTRLSMGVVHSRCQDHMIGCGHYAAALEAFEQLGEHIGMVRVLNNIGLNQRNLGQLRASLDTFERAISIARAQGFDSLIPTLAGSRGRTLLALGRLDEAAASLEQQSGGAAGNPWKQSALDAQLGLIEVASARGERAHAITSLRALIPELAGLGVLDDEVKAWGLLAEALEAAGDSGGALAAYKQLRERERLWLDQRANTRLRASTLMADLDAARREAKEEHRLRDELAKAHATLAIEAAERRARADELYRQSREDGLTGLPNRRDFSERLAEECRRAGRFDQSICIAMIDIDHFKHVNDAYGHATGDKVLIEVAHRLRSALRAGDIVARFGGEEFAALLPQASAADAVTLCERLRSAVETTPVAVGPAMQRVTVSIGFTLYVPPESRDDALARADARLYEAKAAGRNCVAGDAAS